MTAFKPLKRFAIGQLFFLGFFSFLIILMCYKNNFIFLQYSDPHTYFAKPTNSSPISYPPLRPEHDQCWIFRCGDRLLPYTQQPKGDGFRTFNLGKPESFERENRRAGWCRVDHLLALRKLGQRCVVYLDDDVFVKLDALERTIKTAGDDKIIVEAHAEHGMEKHINSGIIAFPDLQSEYVGRVLKEWDWRKFNDKPHALVDQWPFNKVIKCEDENIICLTRRHRKEWGLVNHCFSAFDKIQKGKKQECMRKAKLAVAEWDADPLYEKKSNN